MVTVINAQKAVAPSQARNKGVIQYSSPIGPIRPKSVTPQPILVTPRSSPPSSQPIQHPGGLPLPGTPASKGGGGGGGRRAPTPQPILVTPTPSSISQQPIQHNGGQALP